MTINEIIKRAVERLKREGKLLTPDDYAEVFCDEAKRAGIIVEECKQAEKYLHTLDADIRNEVQQYRIRTTPQLVRFLISKLNRMKPSQCAQQLAAHIALLRRVLQTMELLHNREAAELAVKTEKIVESSVSVEQLEHLRQAWINFLTLYDDGFLQRLSPLGKVDPADLKTTLQNLRVVNGGGEAAVDLEGVAALMVASLVPSIASSVNDTIATLSDTIRDDPQMLTSSGVQQEIKNAIAMRISLDKKSLKEMVLTLDTVLDKLSLQLVELIERSDISTSEIRSIKRELESFESEQQSDFKRAHRKLYSIALTLEERADTLRGDLKAHSSEVNKLGARVRELEGQLAAAREASHEDYLTKLNNRRALDGFMKVKEGEFDRYGRNYSLVFFDIDRFKEVNDRFGHGAGDAVLGAFAGLLKQLCRDVDVIGRYGGEEFLALLSDTDLEGAVTFANKVREQVAKKKFIYKGEHIPVTVSGGVAERRSHHSLKALLTTSDQRLYDAKRGGRNRVEPAR